MKIIYLVFILLLSYVNVSYRLFSYLKENKLAQLTSLLAIDSQLLERKRQNTMRYLTLLAGFWPWINYQPFFLLMIFLALTLAYKWPYWQLLHEFQNQLNKLAYQFPIWLRQLQILMQNNTVYHALSLSLDLAPASFKVEIERLITELKHDPLSYQAYENFMQAYELREIRKVMRLLYRYQTVGQKEAYQQLQRIIQTTSLILADRRQKRQADWLSWHQWYGLLPLAGVTVVFLLLMINVLLSFFTKGVVL